MGRPSTPPSHDRLARAIAGFNDKVPKHHHAEIRERWVAEVVALGLQAKQDARRIAELEETQCTCDSTINE